MYSTTGIEDGFHPVRSLGVMAGCLEYKASLWVGLTPSVGRNPFLFIAFSKFCNTV